MEPTCSQILPAMYQVGEAAGNVTKVFVDWSQEPIVAALFL